MRTAIITGMICCLALAASLSGMTQPGVDYSRYDKITVKGRFGVHFADHVSLNGVARGFGMFRIGVPSVDKIFDDFQVTEVRPLSPVDVGRSTPMSRIYVIEIPKDRDDDRFLEVMRADPNIVRIENDIMCRVHATPNDVSYGSQWAFYQVSRLDIHAQEAWDIETGSDGVVIAIIDSGVNYRHPDLKNNIWINPGEDLDGDMIVFDETDFNDVDDDGNGYKDDVIGYDFFASPGTYPPWSGEDGGIKDNDPNDFNGHGTHCAGTAAAVSNNGLFGAGIAGGWGPFLGDAGVRIMPLRTGYSANVDGVEYGYVMMSAVVEAITYAAYNGADVISYSAGSSNFPGMAGALSIAMDSGIVFSNSAGNSNSDEADYFGTYNGILTVAATNRWDRKWTWTADDGSNYGVWVEVSAPGQDIYSTYSYHYAATYATLTGTSMASPMVSGLAALIKSHYPNFDKTVIDTMIMNHTDNIDAENPSYVGLLGTGRINAYNCLQNAPVARFDATPRIGTAPLTVDFVDQSPATITRTWDFGDGGSSGDETPSHTYIDPGLYTVSLEVTDPNGTCTKTKKYHIFATADTLYGDSTTLVPVYPTDSFPVPVYLKNTIPLEEITLSFDYYTDSGTANLAFKGVSIEGTRTENFDTVIVRAHAPTTGKVAIEISAGLTTASDELPPGDGPVAKLWFKATGSGTMVMDTITLAGYSYEVVNRFVDYLPEVRPIHMWVARRGDANDDGFVNAGDPVYIVNFVFKGGSAPPTVYHGDANADGSVNVADAVFVINYVFKGGPAPGP